MRGTTLHGRSPMALVAVLAVVLPGVANAGNGPAGSLCRAPETVLFTCGIGSRTVSICGGGQDGPVYRFGRPGHVELEARGLHRAMTGFSGGGEEQVYADTPTHRYIVYDKTVRTGFGADGHNDPRETAGLVVQSAGRTIASLQCAGVATFDGLTEKLVPEGEYVEH